MAYIEWLKDLDVREVRSVGGKAANLGLMLSHGMQVPSGFCLFSGAYEDFLESEGLHTKIQDLVAKTDFSKSQSISMLSNQVGQLFAHQQVPSDVIRQVSDAYEVLGCPAVAVRSSGSNEDSSQASFAGQFDSVLNVMGVASVLEAIKMVWTSTWSEAAIVYRAQFGYNQMDTLMAVVVQQLIQADVSGVMLTSDPTQVTEGRLRIESVFGLGDALVSGSVTPDTFVVDKHTGIVLEEIRGEKHLWSVANIQGGIELLENDKECMESLSLDIGQINQLTLLAQAMESFFGGAQDIEWAIKDRMIYILQSRPLVNKSARPEVAWDNPVNGAKWRRTWRLGEWLSDPVTPFFSTTTLPWLVAGRENQGFKHLGWRAKKTFHMPEPWYVIVNGFFFTRADPPFRPSSKSPDHRERAKIVTGRMRWLGRWPSRHLQKYLDHFQAINRMDLTEASSETLLSTLDQLAKDAGEIWYLIAPIGYGFEELFFVPLYEEIFSQKESLHYSVFFSGYDNHALKGQRILYQVAELVKNDEELLGVFAKSPELIFAELGLTSKGKEIRKLLDLYLHNYGHQVYSIDFFFPTVGERPLSAISIVKTYLTAGLVDPILVLRNQAKQRRRATKEALVYVKENVPDKFDAFKEILLWHQLCAKLREDITFYFQLGWPLMREIVQELGVRLSTAGIIDEPGQAFFLEKNEVANACETINNYDQEPSRLNVIAESRKRQWDANRLLNPPDRIPASDDPVWSDTRPGPRPSGGLVVDTLGVRLVGQPSSPGRVSGSVRLVKSVEDFGKVAAGDILVLVANSPGFIPLYPLVSGIVTEVGGGATHGSLVAREFGLVCVTGTGVATQILTDGQQITIDGNMGIVYLD